MRRWLFILLPFVVAASCRTPGTTVSFTRSADNVTVKRLYHDALTAKIAGNNDEAIHLFERVLKMDASNHAAMFELSTLYLDKGALTEAEYYARSAVKHDPANIWYQQVHAEVLALQGSFIDAAGIFEKLIKDNPNDPDYYLQRAHLLELAGKYKEAIRILDQLESLIGVQEQLSDHKSRLYVRLQDMSGAVKELEKLIATDPGFVPFYLKLAELYEVNMLFDDAHKIYQRILNANPDDGLARMSVADYYKRQGKYDLFMENMRMAFRNPELTIDAKVAYMVRYIPMLTLSDSIASEAMKLCEWIIEGHPEEAKGFALYGDVLYQVDSSGLALTQYYQALQFDESVFTVWQQVLYINSELQQFDSLLHWSNEVIDRYPNQVLGYFFKGTAESRLKRHRDAIESFDHALLVGSGNRLMVSEIYSGLGDAYHELSEHVKSDSCYEESLLINPNNAYVLNNYSYYLSLREDNLKRAEEMGRKANDLIPGNSAFQDTYGWVLFKLGRYKDARTWIEKSLAASGSGRAEILEHYGDVMFRLGEAGIAVEYWQKAQEKEPSPELTRKIADRKL